MSTTHPQVKTKKEPYIGDPNATLTMCAKKLRRHLRADMQTFVIPAKDKNSQTQFVVMCRHCKESPVKAAN